MLKYMDLKKSSLGVTETIGTLLLLIIAVAIFSVICVMVLSNEGPTNFIKSDIASTVEGLNIVLEHRGGHSMSLDTNISLTVGPYSKIIYPRGNLSPDNDDGLWGIGERVVIPIASIIPRTCMYGSNTLDYKLEEIEGGGWGGEEADFSDIIKEYNGPTNLSAIDVDIQWSKGYTVTSAMAIDPTKNAISFMGPIDLHHLLDYQKWEFAPGVSSVNLTFEFVDGKGEHTNTFFYYFDGNKNTIKMVTSIHNKGTLEGYTYDLTIAVEGHTSIGFGITSNSESGIDYWYTDILLNGNEMKQALVYDLGKTTLGPIGSYLIGFEDLDRTGKLLLFTSLVIHKFFSKIQ